MKMFTKLALVSSMAISANAMAMQSMDDAALSAATGQDGINIGIGISKIEIEKVLIHDTNGLAASGTGPVAGVGVPGDTSPAFVEAQPASAGYGGTANAGAIVIKAKGGTLSASNMNANNGIVITAPMTVDGSGNPTTTLNTARALDSHNLVDLVIDTDGGQALGDKSGNTAFLNISAAVSGLDIYVGEIGVSGSKAANTGTANIRRGANDTAFVATSNEDGNYNKILSGLTLRTGKMDANIQLGAAPQGAMIVLNTSMIGGLEIKDLGILDNSTKKGNGDGTSAANRAAGEIRLDSIKVADANGANLTVDARVSVIGKNDADTTSQGKGYLQIVTGSGLTTTPKTDIYIKGVKLGSASAGSIGDVEVQGLQTYYNNGSYNTPGAVITISGH